MTNRNPCSYLSSADNKKSIQVAGLYSAHIGLAPSFKLTGLQISLQSGSIIITDMLHRPVLLPHILSDFSRSIPLLQCNVSTFLHVHPKKSRYITANLHSGSTYPHVLYANQYSVVKVQGAYTPISEWKGTPLTDCYATSKANIFVISFVSNLRRKVSSTQ